MLEVAAQYTTIRLLTYTGPMASMLPQPASLAGPSRWLRRGLKVYRGLPSVGMNRGPCAFPWCLGGRSPKQPLAAAFALLRSALSSGRSLLRFQPGLRRLARCTCLRASAAEAKTWMENPELSQVQHCDICCGLGCFSAETSCSAHSELAGGHGCYLNAQSRASPCPRVLEES